jgi:hypothetical protein
MPDVQVSYTFDLEELYWLHSLIPERDAMKKQVWKDIERLTATPPAPEAQTVEAEVEKQ